MKILKLLEMDRACVNELSLPGCLGDSFLLKNNRIFRNVRQGCVESGFSFSDKPESSYSALPLSQLENLMKSRIIPYFNNVDVLQELENRCPAVEWAEVSQNLKRNFVMHESCHAIAVNLDGGSKSPQSRLSILIEESFANTCELFGILDAEDAAHKIFYECNSYSAVFEMKTNLKKACAEIGKAEMFNFFMLGYLHSNFLFNSFSEKQFDSLLSLVADMSGVRLQPAQVKTLKALLKICFTLDYEFRTVTTGLHLKLSFGGRSFPGGDFSYFTELMQNHSHIDKIQRLTKLALKGEK